MSIGSTLYPTRGLQHIYVNELGLYVFIWCQDDKDIDRDKRMCYQVCRDPTEFWPPSGQYVLAKIRDVWNYVHGVPQSIEQVNGAVKVHYHNLPSYSLPRQAYGETALVGVPSGKSAGVQPGNYLEGLLVAAQLLRGPFIWIIKAYTSIHTSSPVVLEVTEAGEIFPGNEYNYAAPTGTLVVEYERDPSGNIKTDAKGAAIVKKIDPSGAESAQNRKIGYLALKFLENLYGNGIHGWVGSAAAERILPFQVFGRADPDPDSLTTGDPQLKVIIHSRLLRSITQTSTISITDLDEWFSAEENSLVFLYIDTDEMTADIFVDLAGSEAWERYPEPIDWIDPYAVNKVQKGVYVLLGYLTGSSIVEAGVESFTLSNGKSGEEHKTLRFIQCVYTDLMLAEMCFEGSNVLYPIPWHGGKITL